MYEYIPPPGAMDPRTAEKYRELTPRLLHRNGFKEIIPGFELLRRHATGMRKDGITPEDLHAISIGIAAFNVSAGLPRQERAALTFAGFTHDLLEDHQVTRQELYQTALSMGGLTAELATETVLAVTHKIKTEPDFRIDRRESFRQCGYHRLGPIVKLLDRAQNLHSMLGVFTVKRMGEYLIETREHILPMAKIHRAEYPDLKPINRILVLDLHRQLAAPEMLMQQGMLHLLARPQERQ